MISEYNNDNNYGEFGMDEHPAGKRWDPLGAPNDDNEQREDAEAQHSTRRYDNECTDHHW